MTQHAYDKPTQSRNSNPVTPNSYVFASEQAFEEAVVSNLTKHHGWSPVVLNYASEKDLINNWAQVVFNNNNSIERLNGVPLSEGEKETLVAELAQRTNPIDMHLLLQGKFLSLVRDNPKDTRNHGKTIQLQIFDPVQVGGGDSTYQIARQPRFDKKNSVDKTRRGDFILLIWGLPLIHVELKNSGHDYSEAVIQIQRYMDQSVFTGLFATIQVFVAMTPTDMRYFARPIDADSFNSDFHFRWTRSDNEYYDSWHDLVRDFLGIPMAHMLVGDHMIPDQGDGVLKVLRPYQIHAVNAVIRKLHDINKLESSDWTRTTHKGGYIWHTTGSGKTMTSFKTAALVSRRNITDSQTSSQKNVRGLADKVVFVFDRIELGKQSFKEYSNFADASVELHYPGSAQVLLRDLKDASKHLIVTSIQKLGDICAEDSQVGDADFATIQKQRIVFVVDEAHRTTFGQQFADLHHRFSHSVFIGFTGTPIHEVNKKKDTTTSHLFGDELHRYSIYYGLRDKNVLGFETVPVDTMPDLREKLALRAAVAVDVADVMADSEKMAIYDKIMDEEATPWATYNDPDTGKTVKGIEDLAGTENWKTPEQRQKVVDYITENWERRSRGSRLHAMLATSSVAEALAYYRLFKAQSNLKVTVVVNDADEHTSDAIERDRGIREFLTDYNDTFNQSFGRDNFADYKVDVQHRLAHKEGYRYITNEPEKQLDLVIVVYQMLTGYDSKWVNTLYLDRVIEFENIVQAFSRTNRILDNHLKPFGSIVYFRKIHTMGRNIVSAFDEYSGNKSQGIFVDELSIVLDDINNLYGEIRTVFSNAGITDFAQLPVEREACQRFAVRFTLLSQKVESALIQGFVWGQSHYDFTDTETGQTFSVYAELTKPIYDVLLSRYAELATDNSDNESDEGQGSIRLDLGTLTQARDAQRIDYDYMEKRFEKVRDALRSHHTTSAEREELISQLQTSYAALSQEDQVVAGIVLNDLLNNKIDLDEDKSFRDYINEYKATKQDLNIQLFYEATGINTELIREVLEVMDGTEEELTSFEREKSLRGALDIDVFSDWLSSAKGVSLTGYKLRMASNRLIREFFLNNSIDPATWDTDELKK